MTVCHHVVTHNTLYNATNITVRKLLVVAVPNFEICLRRHWQENIQPDNQQNHCNSLAHVVMGEKKLGFTLSVLTYVTPTIVRIRHSDQ